MSQLMRVKLGHLAHAASPPEPLVLFVSYKMSSRYPKVCTSLLCTSTLRQVAIKSINLAKKTALVQERAHGHVSRAMVQDRAQHYHMVSGNALGLSPAGPAGAKGAEAEKYTEGFLQPSSSDRPASQVCRQTGRRCWSL